MLWKLAGAKALSSRQGKSTLKWVLLIAVVFVVVILFKPLMDIFGSLGKNLKDAINGLGGVVGDAAEGLGITDEKEKPEIDKVVNSGLTPLSSGWFDRAYVAYSKGKQPGDIAFVLPGGTKVTELVNQLYASRSFLSDSPTKVMNVIVASGSQMYFGAVAKAFQQKKGYDLLTWLRGVGSVPPNDGFNDKSMKSFIDKVNALPFGLLHNGTVIKSFKF